MKVLMFGWEFPPHNSGGLGVACHGLVRALSKKGVEVVFVLPKRLAGIKDEGYRVIFADVASRGGLLSAYGGRWRGGAGNYSSGLLREVEEYAELASDIARREGHDVIHCHDWLSFGAGLSAKGVSGKPMIAHVHATEVDRTAGNVDLEIYERERAGVLAADRVVSVSEYTRNILITDYGIDPERVEAVHNGIDLEQYNLEEKPDVGMAHLKDAGYRIVLYYGRITVMKGVDYLVRAAERVVRSRPKTMFVIVGSGDMEGQIMKEVSALGLLGNFLFPGFLRGKELSSVIRSADLFVCPSVSEPFGLTPLEAQAHGAPVILSKQSGVSEVLHHAMKVDFWDIEEMADKIISALKYSPMRKVMATNGKVEAMRCDWDGPAQKCVSLYERL